MGRLSTSPSNDVEKIVYGLFYIVRQGVLDFCWFCIAMCITCMSSHHRWYFVTIMQWRFRRNDHLQIQRRVFRPVKCSHRVRWKNINRSFFHASAANSVRLFCGLWTWLTLFGASWEVILSHCQCLADGRSEYRSFNSLRIDWNVIAHAAIERSEPLRYSIKSLSMTLTRHVRI